jgi:hypothetical protein
VVFNYRDTSLAVPVLLKIKEDPRLKKPVTIPESPPRNLPKDAPMINAGSGSVQVPLVKFGMEYEDNKITLYIGVDVDHRNLHDGKGWQGPFKSMINDTMEQTDYFLKLMDYYKQGNALQGEGVGMFSASGGALGYVELAYNEKNELVVIGGRVAIFAGFGYTWFYQGVVWVVPFYVSIGVGGELAVQFVSEHKPIHFEDFFQNITLTVMPYVDGELGVGVYGLLSVGLGLHAGIEMNYEVRKNHFAGDMGLDMLFRARALFVFSYEKKLAGAHWKIDHDFISGPAIPEGFLAFDMSIDLRMESRDYLTAGSEWLGDVSPPAVAGGGDPMLLQPLKSNILPGSEPRLILFNGREVLFWIDDAGHGRAASDRTALMFSMCNKDGSWSAPQMVFDDGTGDYHFDALVFQGKLYAVWQNTRQAFRKENVTLAEVNTNSEILVTWYDSAGGRFQAPERMKTDADQHYYGLPRLTTDGKTLRVVYVENTQGDNFLKSGMTFFRSEKLTEGAWSNLHGDVYYVTKPVVDWDVLTDGDMAQVVICEDQDGDLSTLDDRMIIRGYSHYHTGRQMMGSVHLTRPQINGNLRITRWNGKQALFYYHAEKDDNGAGNILYYPNLFQADAGRGGAKVLKTPYRFPGTFSLVTGPGGKIGILLTDDTTRLMSVPRLIMYSPVHDTWGLPTLVGPMESFQGKRAEALHGVWGDNGRIDVVYRSLAASAAGREGDPPATTLVFASTVPAPDLVVTADSIYRYYGPQFAGGLVPIRVGVVNGGLDIAHGVSLNIRWNGPNGPATGYWSIHKNVVLHPGESAVLPVSFRLPKTAENKFDLFIEAKPCKGTELNYLNNGALITFAEPDLAIGDIDMQRKGLQRRFIVPVENRGPVRIRGIQLLVKDQTRGEIVRTFSLADLNAFQTEKIDFTLELKDLNWDSPHKLLIFEVKSQDMTKPGYHSSPFVLINPFSQPPYSLAVFRAKPLGDGYIWVEAAAANNHPRHHSGDLVIELLDRNEQVEVSSLHRIDTDAGKAAIANRLFRVSGAPSTYTTRVSMKNVQLPSPGQEITGGLERVGGMPVPVEVSVDRTEETQKQVSIWYVIKGKWHYLLQILELAIAL